MLSGTTKCWGVLTRCINSWSILSYLCVASFRSGGLYYHRWYECSHYFQAGHILIYADLIIYTKLSDILHFWWPKLVHLVIILMRQKCSTRSSMHVPAPSLSRYMLMKVGCICLFHLFRYIFIPINIQKKVNALRIILAMHVPMTVMLTGLLGYWSGHCVGSILH